MIRLGIGLPCYGLKLDIGHAAMWLGLGAALATATDKVTLAMFNEYSINGIDLARNTIVWDAIQANCDWVLMIDADTFHRSTTVDGNPDAIGDAGVDLIQMIRDADRGQFVNADGVLCNIPMRPNNGVGLVGAPVRGRGGNPSVCVQQFGHHTDPHGRKWELMNQRHITPLTELRDKVQTVARIGGACIAVNCRWLQQHWRNPPWFEPHHDYSTRPSNGSCGEDYSICDGIWHRGGVVLCDGRFAPEHVAGRKLVEGTD